MTALTYLLFKTTRKLRITIILTERYGRWVQKQIFIIHESITHVLKVSLEIIVKTHFVRLSKY